MMTESEIRAWLALLDSGLSFSIIRKLCDHYDDPRDLLEADESSLAAAGLNAEQARRLRDAESDRARQDRQLRLMEQLDIHVLKRNEPAFPKMLRGSACAPPILFVRGELTDWDRLAVAMVGPRIATTYGLNAAQKLARELAPMLTVVSGLAVGIDSAAHQAALDAGGRTIGVAACGLDQDYPQGLGNLRERITESGALVSAWPPLTKANTPLFPQRNAILAAMCLGVIIVEASLKSGSLLTARAAAEEGREVWAVPGDITRQAAQGSNQLLREGASVATSARDIIADLQGRIEVELKELKARKNARAEQEPDNSTPQPPPPSADSPESQLLKLIAHESQPYDALLERFVPSTMTLGQLATSLLTLEITGQIHQLPGRVYAIK